MLASEIIAVTGFFILMIVLTSMYFRTRHIERMELIKNGKTAAVFDKENTDSNGALKAGLFLLSIGLGLLVGIIIDNMLDSAPAASFICILILGGISLIYYHNYIEKHRIHHDQNQPHNDDLMV